MNILNLSSVEATRIFQKFSSFEDARDFVESYDLNFDIHWIDAIYHQVIENQNFTYFNDYVTSFPTTSKLWVAISEKFRTDTNITLRVPAFKHFLSYLDD